MKQVATLDDITLIFMFAGGLLFGITKNIHYNLLVVAAGVISWIAEVKFWQLPPKDREIEVVWTKDGLRKRDPFLMCGVMTVLSIAAIWMLCTEIFSQ